MFKRCRQNNKQRRPWSDCSMRSSLIWVCTVCSDLSVPIFKIITVVYNWPTWQLSMCRSPINNIAHGQHSTISPWFYQTVNGVMHTCLKWAWFQRGGLEWCIPVESGHGFSEVNWSDVYLFKVGMVSARWTGVMYTCLKWACFQRGELTIYSCLVDSSNIYYWLVYFQF